MRSAHVFPVPNNMSPQESWDEIRLMGCLLTENTPASEEDCKWAYVIVEEEDDQSADS